MTHRLPRRARFAALAVLLVVPTSASGQSDIPRTSWGDPDLQGVWDYNADRTTQPLQRPRSGRCEGEVASLVFDPPSGRIPELTPAAQQTQRAVRRGRRPADSWEDRNLNERCIMGNNNGPPMLPGPGNNLVQVFQTADHVALLNERIHDVRIIPLDQRPRLNDAVHQWMGSSRGHWERETLVIETGNFSDKAHLRGAVWQLASPDLHIVERLTRVDADTLRYEVSVTDPATWTQPWSAAVPLQRSAGPIYEYACHEGNYSLTNILRAGRAEAEDIVWWTDMQPSIELHVDDFADLGETVRLEAEAVAKRNARVERVEFLVDQAVVGVDTAAPYDLTWTATGVGRHTLAVVVEDSAGRVARSYPSKPFFVGRAALERSPVTSADDAEEDASGRINVTSRGLDLGVNDCSLVGVRFELVRVPRNAEIARAYLQFRADSGTPYADEATLVVYGELTGNSMLFDTAGGNLSSRRTTLASVRWSPEPWTMIGERSDHQRTPDLSSLIEEVVAMPGWRTGNALTLIIGGSGHRRADSQDNRGAPTLYIELAE